MKEPHTLICRFEFDDPNAFQIIRPKNSLNKNPLQRVNYRIDSNTQLQIKLRESNDNIIITIDSFLDDAKTKAVASIYVNKQKMQHQLYLTINKLKISDPDCDAHQSVIIEKTEPLNTHENFFDLISFYIDEQNKSKDKEQQKLSQDFKRSKISAEFYQPTKKIDNFAKPLPPPARSESTYKRPSFS